MTWFQGFLSGAIISPVILWAIMETAGAVHHYGKLVCIW